jgi:protein-disulfide isomerase
MRTLFQQSRVWGWRSAAIAIAGTIGFGAGFFVFPLQTTQTMLLQPLEFDLGAPATFFHGPPEAPLTLIEISDFSCVHCRRFQRKLGRITHRFGDSLRLGFIPYVSNAPESKVFSRAYAAAARQNAGYAMKKALFAAAEVFPRTKDDGEGRATAAAFRIADSLGLDLALFEAILDDSNTDALLDSLKASARRNGVRTTPSACINRYTINGPLTEKSVTACIERFAAVLSEES